jgi:uncharacterized membrane protein
LSLPLAASTVVLVSILANRILAIVIGLWFQVPVTLLLGLLLLIDIIQIPFYYRLYEHGSSLLERVPAVNKFLRRDWSVSSLGQWAKPLGGFGVMMVAAMPTFGGGMWSATFIAYGLGLKRRAGYAWMILGSALSYFTLYWILDMLVRTCRYFIH